MSKGNVKVSYIVFNQPHEEVFDKNTTLDQLRTYMAGLCSTFLITGIQTTTKPISTVKVEDDGC